MPLDQDAINDYIREVLRTALGIEDENFFRPANQTAPTGKINEPFGTVLVSELDTVGVDGNQYIDDGVEHELTVTTSGMRRITASVQLFRAGSKTKASRLGGLLRTPAVTTLMNSRGLGLIRVGKVTDLSQVIDTYWEERAQLEIALSVASVETSTISTFATVPININIETASTTSEVELDS